MSDIDLETVLRNEIKRGNVLIDKLRNNPYIDYSDELTKFINFMTKGNYKCIPITSVSASNYILKLKGSDTYVMKAYLDKHLMTSDFINYYEVNFSYIMNNIDKYGYYSLINIKYPKIYELGIINILPSEITDSWVSKLLADFKENVSSINPANPSEYAKLLIDSKFHTELVNEFVIKYSPDFNFYLVEDSDYKCYLIK